jgi:replicative DNA helicase
MVDYAQRIGTRKHHEAFRHSQIEIATSLKGMARELDICVVLLAQSGRAVDQREPKSWGQMPQMGDIQESAAYEQEADMVMGLARNGGAAMLGVLKNRHGPVGLVPMEFDEPTMEFRSAGVDRGVRM